MQLTSTESLLLLPAFTETSFNSILTKVSFGRVPLMYLLTIFTKFLFNCAFLATNRRYCQDVRDVQSRE